MSYYAVKVGHTTGIFNNWAECQKATQGYPGPKLKKFATLAEAEAFINDVDIFGEQIKNDIANGYAVAFCDGSFDSAKNRYSYGVFIIDKDFKEHELSGRASNPKYVSSRNIIGEVLGAINAMDWAVSNGYKKIKIYHDYEGLSKWLSGEWAARSEVANMFVYIYNTKFADLVQVTFEKVKGHSNNKYNDKADELARKALYSNS
jgi:ribonuclease HI